MAGQLSRRRFLTLVGLGGAAALGGALGPLSSAKAGAPGVFDLGDVTVSYAGTFYYFLPVVVAKERGFFEEEGVRVGELVPSFGGAGTIQNFSDRGMLVAEVLTPAALTAIAFDGLDARVVAAGVSSLGSLGWVVRPDSLAFTLQDLRGQSLGYTRAGSISQAALQLVLEGAPGISPEDVEAVETGGVREGFEKLRAGEIDAAAALEPLTSTGAADLRLVFFARSFVPSYAQTVWIARRDFLEAFLPDETHPLARFLRARKRAVEFIVQNPEEAALTLIKYLFLPLEPAVALLSLGEEGVFAGTYYSGGRLSGPALVRVERGMQRSALIARDRLLPLEDVVDQRVLPAAGEEAINIPPRLELAAGARAEARITVEAAEPYVHVQNFGPGAVAVRFDARIEELPPLPRAVKIPAPPGELLVEVEALSEGAKVRVF